MSYVGLAVDHIGRVINQVALTMDQVELALGKVVELAEWRHDEPSLMNQVELTVLHHHAELALGWHLQYQDSSYYSASFHVENSQSMMMTAKHRKNNP